MDKKKNAAINIINKKENKWFQYPVKIALNCKEPGKGPERITKSRPFINKYNWEGIISPLEKDF